MTNFAFLHGGGQASWVWEEVIRALEQQSGASDSHMVALDVPGCGTKRCRNTEAIDLDSVTEELIADIEHSGMTNVVLVGHSNAGTTLPRMARRRPDLFRRLVYVTCCAPAPGQTTLEMMGAGRHGENPEEVGWPVPRDASDPRERYRAMFCNDMEPKQSDAFLAKLGYDNWPNPTYPHRDHSYDHLDAMPSTYVVCLRDGSLTVPWQERFADRLRVDRRVYLDAGHQAMNTRPHALAEILLAEA